MKENNYSKLVVNTAFRIHTNLGPGLFESVYEEILFYELNRLGLEVKRQVVIPIVWNNKVLDRGFRADIIVEDSVLLEIKSVENLAPVHSKQVLTYLKLTGIKLGLLLNFNKYLIRDGITRIVNGL